jgi:hypothetical protein
MLQYPINKRKDNMNNEPFYITYFAKKHAKFITRKGQYNKPDGTEGKSLVDKSGNKRLIYWDLDAEPNANGNRWRQAVGEVTIKY